jgi:hypothetical protein
MRYRAVVRSRVISMMRGSNWTTRRPNSSARAVALGRKNYLFAGSDSGGERAACLYSLLGTAKLNGLDPELYLREVLGRIADQPINRISDLLPWNIDPITPPEVST